MTVKMYRLTSKCAMITLNVNIKENWVRGTWELSRSYLYNFSINLKLQVSSFKRERLIPMPRFWNKRSESGPKNLHSKQETQPLRHVVLNQITLRKHRFQLIPPLVFCFCFLLHSTLNKTNENFYLSDMKLLSKRYEEFPFLVVTN